MFYPIFSESFLQSHLYNFKLSTIPNIRPIKRMIENFILELESGKIDSLKEEEIKSRFVNTFFGDVLGYNYGNSNNWLLREEKKSKINGTKPDAVLGYFFKNKEDDDVRVIFDIGPATKGHALVIPKTHVANVFEIPNDLLGKAYSVAKKIAQALKETTGCEGINILQNNGEMAGQSVFHFHIHVIPRYEGDTANIKWEQGTADSDYLNELAGKVKEILSK